MKRERLKWVGFGVFVILLVMAFAISVSTTTSPCKENSDCGKGKFCHFGLCSEFECQKDVHCSRTQVCLKNVCATIEQTGDESCITDTECKDKYSSSPFSVDCRCVECRNDGDCSKGQCRAGICLVPFENDGEVTDVVEESLPDFGVLASIGIALLVVFIAVVTLGRKLSGWLLTTGLLGTTGILGITSLILVVAGLLTEIEILIELAAGIGVFAIFSFLIFGFAKSAAYELGEVITDVKEYKDIYDNTSDEATKKLMRDTFQNMRNGDENAARNFKGYLFKIRQEKNQGKVMSAFRYFKRPSEYYLSNPNPGWTSRWTEENGQEYLKKFSFFRSQAKAVTRERGFDKPRKQGYPWGKDEEKPRLLKLGRLKNVFVPDLGLEKGVQTDLMETYRSTEHF